MLFALNVQLKRISFLICSQTLTCPLVSKVKAGGFQFLRCHGPPNDDPHARDPLPKNVKEQFLYKGPIYTVKNEYYKFVKILFGKDLASIQLHYYV